MTGAASTCRLVANGGGGFFCSRLDCYSGAGSASVGAGGPYLPCTPLPTWAAGDELSALELAYTRALPVRLVMSRASSATLGVPLDDGGDALVVVQQRVGRGGTLGEVVAGQLGAGGVAGCAQAGLCVRAHGVRLEGWFSVPADEVYWRLRHPDGWLWLAVGPV